MLLKYFKMFMHLSVSDNLYCAHFDYHVFFIGYYVSHQLRKLKFETDGTFDAIFVVAGAETLSTEIFRESLIINIPFDFNYYDNADELKRNNYYVDLIKSALQIAAKQKKIPLAELMGYIESLVDNNYIYSWDFKNILVRELNLKLKFTCQLSTNDFIMRIAALDKKSMMPICEGIVIRTMPCNEIMSYISKKIQIRDNRICIYNPWGCELLTINLNSLIDGHLIIDYSESPYPDNPNATDTFKELQAALRYDNYDFI